MDQVVHNETSTTGLSFEHHFSHPLYLIATAAVVLGTLYYRLKPDALAKLPSFNPPQLFDFGNNKRTQLFLHNSIETLRSARARFGDEPFKLWTEWGELLMLSPKTADSFKSDKRLNFSLAISDDSHGYISGFEAFADADYITSVVTKYITKALTKLTGPVSEEALLALPDILTDSPEWHDFHVRADLMDIVSRLSTRVFMGAELCRDEGWNKASIAYTTKVSEARDILGQYPRWSRSIVHWFMPVCWDVRRSLAAVKKCLQPHIDRRQQHKREMEMQGKTASYDDSIEWFAREHPDHDPAIAQITLSFVAIHTTSDLLSQTVINIARHPELFDALRSEAISVLQKDGLKKTALYNLKLMDSVVKETQRLKPVTLGGVRRLVLQDMTLPDGMALKKGTKLVIDTSHMWSPDYYENPEEFDGYRYLRVREGIAGDEAAPSAPFRETSSKTAHLVSTSVSHIGFGHGLHSCPGRFFAANEVKIALCHLLLMYDWKLPGNASKGTEKDLEPVALGMSYVTNPAATLLVRRRQEEVDFASLEA